jgi:2-succinyl-6-hydroxy-2,4-cyclohexadiene-1-carboxylate synthase
MNINGLNYHVEIIGNGPEHVLLLHGFTGKGSNFYELLDSIELKEQYTFILVDQPGHGQTDAPTDPERYKMEQICNDLKGILESLQVKKVSLYGYSMGGRAALTFAVEYPHLVKKLILESSSPGLEKDEERHARKQADERLADRIEKEGLLAFVKFWTDIPLFQTQRELSKVKQKEIFVQRMDNSTQGLANSLRGMGTGVQPSNWNRLLSINYPVLLAAGEQDEKFVLIAQEMKKRIKKSQFIKISEAGHAIHVEQPRKFGKIVSEFLSN